MDTQIPQAVTDARSNAAQLGKVAADYAGSEYTIPDQLRKVVQEALNYNQDVIGMRSSALADYQAAPAQANAKFGVQTFGTGPQAGQTNPDYIFNPFERNSAIQSFVANQSIPFNTSNALLGMRQGTVADTIGAGTRAFQAQSAAAQAAAAAAQKTYTDVLNEFQIQSDIATKKRQLDIEQQKANQTGANNQIDPIIAAFLKQIKDAEDARNKKASITDAIEGGDMINTLFGNQGFSYNAPSPTGLTTYNPNTQKQESFDISTLLKGL